MSKVKIPFSRDKLNAIKAAPAVLSVGKNGITENVIQEIKFYLKKNKILKLKFQKSILNPILLTHEI